MSAEATFDLIMLAKADMARDESRKKSERAKAAWRLRREKMS